MGASARDWPGALRRYVAVVIVANLAWEIAQLPLYTIWSESTPRDIAFAIAHCTAGDFVIATVSLVIALLLVADAGWPATGAVRVAIVAIAIGVSYTIFSEWLNIVVRKSWQYAAGMPVLPYLGTGLSPLAQWIVVPAAGFWWAIGRRA